MYQSTLTLRDVRHIHIYIVENNFLTRPDRVRAHVSISDTDSRGQNQRARKRHQNAAQTLTIF